MKWVVKKQQRMQQRHGAFLTSGDDALYPVLQDGEECGMLFILGIDGRFNRDSIRVR
jgi:hypothetical protein